MQKLEGRSLGNCEGFVFDHYTTKVAALPFSSQVTFPNGHHTTSTYLVYGLSRVLVEFVRWIPGQSGSAGSYSREPSTVHATTDGQYESPHFHCPAFAYLLVRVAQRQPKCVRASM